MEGVYTQRKPFGDLDEEIRRMLRTVTGGKQRWAVLVNQQNGWGEANDSPEDLETMGTGTGGEGFGDQGDKDDRDIW